MLAIIQQRFQDSPDQCVLRHYLGKDSIESIRARELWELSDGVALRLREAGVGAGSVVGIAMRRSIVHVASLLAIFRLGATAFSLNQRLAPPQASPILALARPAVLLLDNPALISWSRTTPTLPDSSVALHLRTEPLNAIQEQCLNKLRQRIPLVSASPDASMDVGLVEQAPDRPAIILFTSGSTGAPKGVAISHADLTARARSEAEAYGLSPKDTLLHVLPFSFDVGLNQLLSALVSGAELVLLNSWSGQDMVNAGAATGVTGMSAVPEIWRQLMTLDAEFVRPFADSLRYATISGGDLSPAGHEKLRRMAPTTPIFKTYGQSETFRSGMLLPHEYASRPYSVGRPPKDVRVGIMRPDGSRADPGEEGEIVHAGVGVMLGYVGDPPGSAAKLAAPECFGVPAVLTGDRGIIDEQGYLTVLGRRDRMLKVKGNRFYPREVEAALESHESVAEAVLLAIPAPGDGDPRLIAEVLPAKGGVDPDALALYLMARVPSYMRPESIVVVKEFPRTPSGKIRLQEVENKYRAS